MPRPRSKGNGQVWNREARQLLAECLRNYTCLWNMKDFYSAELKRDAYNNLLKQIAPSVPNLDLRDLKRQIKNERDYFRVQKCMVERSKQMGDEPVEPGWFLWETYQYLADGMQHRDRTFIPALSSHQRVTGENDDDDVDEDDYTVEHSDSQDDTLFLKQKDQYMTNDQPKTLACKRSKIDDEGIPEDDTSIDINHQTEFRPAMYKDEWDIFAMDIANDIRRLPEHFRWQAKCSIRRLVEDLVVKTMPTTQHVLIYDHNYSSEQEPVDTKPVIADMISYSEADAQGSKEK
ncbi:uncharacterized protein LOC141899403 [Tubulanus polymorphus]|uniref:uncharacterized protein LOC141899403 n=1 Tax=Tubulanus polymorphus TaxID=672921 RepID=UPI003DA4C65D